MKNKKFSVILTKVFGQGTTTFKFYSVYEARRFAGQHQPRLIDIMEYDGSSWISLMH